MRTSKPVDTVTADLLDNTKITWKSDYQMTMKVNCRETDYAGKTIYVIELTCINTVFPKMLAHVAIPPEKNQTLILKRPR